MHKAKSNLAGMQFERLRVLREAGRSKNGKRCWECSCDCGARTVVREDHLVRRKIRSCGCLMRELSLKRFTKHGHSAGQSTSPTYISWQAMSARCTNPKHAHFQNYGGRGIQVCDRWSTSNPDGFVNFLTDLGERPIGKTLDRINNDGDYCPENCKWSDWFEQAANTRHVNRRRKESAQN